MLAVLWIFERARILSSLKTGHLPGRDGNPRPSHQSQSSRVITWPLNSHINRHVGQQAGAYLYTEIQGQERVHLSACVYLSVYPSFSSPPSIPSWTRDLIPPNNLSKTKLLLGEILSWVIKNSAFSEDKRKTSLKSLGLNTWRSLLLCTQQQLLELPSLDENCRMENAMHRLIRSGCPALQTKQSK